MKKLFNTVLAMLSASLLFACSSAPTSEDIYNKLEEEGFTFEISYDQSSEDPSFFLDITGDDYSFRYIAETYNSEAGALCVYSENGSLLVNSLEDKESDIMLVNNEFYARFDETASSSADTELTDDEKVMADVARQNFNTIFEDVGTNREGMYSFCKEYLSENYGDAIIK